MIIVACLLLLQISFTLHIYFLIKWVLSRENRYMKGFLNTSVTNILVTGALSFLAIFRPETIRNVNISFLLWLSSGFVMLVMLFVKISLFRRIYGRAQDPANYHLNFFGKKVLHPTVVKAEEVLIFFITIPFFLFAGAYFIARLVNLMMFGRL